MRVRKNRLMTMRWYFLEKKNFDRLYQKIFITNFCEYFQINWIKKIQLLVVFGFLFADEHIESLTKKALRNITLKTIIFAYDNNAQISFEKNSGLS